MLKNKLAICLFRVTDNSRLKTEITEQTALCSISRLLLLSKLSYLLISQTKFEIACNNEQVHLISYILAYVPYVVFLMDMDTSKECIFLVVKAETKIFNQIFPF